MSSDEEFEKFLQGDSDDEQTALAKTKKKASKKKSSAAKGSSSKSKGKQDAKSTAPSLALDDSADPYNFDMAPPAFSRSSDDDDDFQVKKAAQKKKKKDADEKAPPPKKVSLEDRMADILKRHGSSMADTFAKPKEPDVVAPPEIKAPPPNEDDDQADAASEAAHSSSSDSLGMESADFEVGGYAKKAPPPPLKKPVAEVVEKAPFRVNDQLPQQHQQPDRFASAKASVLHEEDEDDDDGYDDEFLDTSTTVAAPPVSAPATPPTAPATAPTAPATAPAAPATSTPAPFKSEFEKMKELFSMPIEDRYDDTEQSQGDAYQADDFEEEPSPMKAPPPAAATPTLENPMDKYDDDEFEDSDGPPPSPPPSPPQAPLSPGPPPPPPLDPTSPVPALSLNEPKQRGDAIKATTPPKTGLPSFLDESFEFKYDLRSKVETISAPPDDDEEAPPPPPATAPIAAAPLSSQPTEPSTQSSDPLVSSTAPPAYSSSGQAAPQFQATQSATMQSTQLSTATQSISGPGVAHSQPRHQPTQLVQPDGSDTKLNPIAAKFHSLQDQLNRSSIGPSSAVAGSIDTSLAQAFERDKYILRAFSAKENEMKLQLQAAHREILSLRHQVEALATEQQVHTLSDARMLGKLVQPTGGVHMTNHAWDAMKKDIESQEALIQGYQVENERLMHQLREVRRDLQYDVHLNNQQLQATIKDLRHQLDTSTQHPPAASHHLAAQLRADSRIIALEEELHQARQDHARRERELKFELDQVKKAKVDLECRVAGVRMDTLHRENEAFEALKRQTDAKLADAHAQIESLQSKVDWYVQNQRFIDDQDELVKQLRETVATLQEQLADKALSRPSSNNSKKPAARTSSAADKRRIQALEAQLKEMHIAMRKRHPDSLVNLILASKPTADELLAKEQHEQQLQQLKDQLADMEKQHEVKLTKFRQQHERVVQQLRDQATAKTPADNTQSSDVAKVRLYYQSKIKELERKLEAKQVAKAEKGPSPISQVEPSSTTTASQDEQRDREVALLQRQLAESENARRQLVEAFNSSNVPAAAPPPTPPQVQTAIDAPTPAQTALVAALEARNAELEADLGQVHTAMAALTETHKANMQHAKDMWQDEVVHLSEKLSASQADCARLSHVAARVPILESAVETLQAKLTIPNTPSMLQYQALEMQIHTLTQKHAIRETELQVLLQHATQNTKVEVMQLQQRHDRAMALKCAEIATFQAQLDDMLAELKRLQQHP